MERTSLIMAMLAVTAAGCTQFPDLDRTLTPELEQSAYPDLVPLDPLLARAEQTGVEPVQATAAIDGRVAALRARAAGLSGAARTGPARQGVEEGVR